MDFPHGVTVYRDRRKQIPNPARPGTTIPGDWANVDTITIPDAFVGSASASAMADATRTESTVTKSLYCTDPAVDVTIGDRIRTGGLTYYVNALPAADINPFTGWQPVKEIPLSTNLG